MEEEKRLAEEEAKAPPKPSKWAWLTGNSNKLAFWKMFGGNDGLSAQIRDLLGLFKVPQICQDPSSDQKKNFLDLGFSWKRILFLTFLNFFNSEYCTNILITRWKLI